MGKMEAAGLRMQWGGGGSGRGWLGCWTQWNRRHHLGCRVWGRAASCTGDQGSDHWVMLPLLMQEQRKCRGDIYRASQSLGTKSSKFCLCRPPASAPNSLPLAYSTWLLILLVDIFLLLQVVSSLRATALSWPSLDLQILVENSTCWKDEQKDRLLTLCPFYGGRSWSSERASDLLKVTQAMDGWIRHRN